ncbi:MAG: thiamine-phosphate kinase, partial [Chloroflexi bacterium]|nr:thiamine-phosphate kinase [Chloroflexota bacterium]
MGEFELIGRFADVLGTDLPPEIVVGIGDDCAVARRGTDFDVYTTDTVVDGVHFRRGQIPWFDLGWKSVAVNLSDIAAMGARPLHCLVTLGVPEYVTGDEL